MNQELKRIKLTRFYLFWAIVMILLTISIVVNNIFLETGFPFIGSVNERFHSIVEYNIRFKNAIILSVVTIFVVIYFAFGIFLILRFLYKGKPISAIYLIVLFLLICGWLIWRVFSLWLLILLMGDLFSVLISFFDLMLSLTSMTAILLYLIKRNKKIVEM